MTPRELARFRAGDADWFRELVERHSPRVVGVCRGFAADDDAAHDLAQETWLRVWAKRRSYRGGSFTSWLLAVCRSVCLSSVRGSTRSPVRSPVETLPDPSTSGEPERAARRAELAAAITRALFDLPTRQREVVVHRLVEGLSTRETARAMGCAEGTVKAALHQALARLSVPLDRFAPTNADPERRAAARTGAHA